ncbi:MAG: tRNA (N6-isopentenyl adenosine(37)-C2)-methylthiotransferase MiaB, partial [Promicromonosporaceae bacterium]|nr:tRNA (N6-isopentenyl adenosine(37)-C2)-methylthiotransferase MiaB [Promicromonosporaceae bacterium]
EAAITPGVIVGFPGETEADFAETMRVVEAAQFDSAYTFQYSIRPGTPAADMPNQVPAEVVTERFNRLVALQERVSTERAARWLGQDVEVLVIDGGGKKDGQTHRLSGRAPDNRLVHFSLPPAEATAGRSVVPRPGDMVTVTVTQTAPHHLIADSALSGGTFAVRRTPSGEAWQRTQPGAPEAHSHGGPSAGSNGGGPNGSGPVALGMPTLGARPQGGPPPKPQGC